MAGAQDKLAQNQLGLRCKTRPMPTQPNLSLINRQLVPHFKGIEVCVFYHLTARIAPSRSRMRRLVCSFSARGWHKYQHFRHNEHFDIRKQVSKIRGHAVKVNIPHVQMSIQVNSQPNWSEYTNSFSSLKRPFRY